MPKGVTSYCINHPSTEAAARCKQCRTPVCDVCATAGPSGIFCSDVCREKHEAFVERAKQLEEASRRPGWHIGLKIRRFVVKLVVYAILLLFVASVADLVFGIRIPWWSDILRRYL